MSNDEGALIAGAYGPGNIPDELFKYDKDKAGALLYIKRGTTKLMHMINKRFGKRTVTSFTPKWFDIQELDTVMTLTGDQVDSNDGYRLLKMTNSHATQLQPGDLLAVNGLFLADGRGTSTAGTYSRVWSPDFPMEEQLMVVRRPVMDSAGTGEAYVEVRRGWVAAYSTGRLMSEPARSAESLLKNGDKLLHMGNAQWTGSDAPYGYSKNIEVESNPLQIMRFAFEEVNEVSLEKTFLTETQMSINQKLALNKLAYNMEFRALFNRPVKEQHEGNWRYAMGGLFDYIPTDNYLDYSNAGAVKTMDWMAFQKYAMAPLFELGGSSDKVGFCSISTFSNFANLLWNKVQISISESWSKGFGFEIYEISGGGGQLKLVPSWVYGRNTFRANQILALDFGGPYFKIDVMEDLHINKGPGGQGLQLPGQEITKFEYKCILGMQHRAKQYHAIIGGLPPLVPNP